MKCPECGYVTFDHLGSCPQCQASFRLVRRLTRPRSVASSPDPEAAETEADPDEDAERLRERIRDAGRERRRSLSLDRDASSGPAPPDWYQPGLSREPPRPDPDEPLPDPRAAAGDEEVKLGPEGSDGDWREQLRDRIREIRSREQEEEESGAEPTESPEPEGIEFEAPVDARSDDEDDDWPYRDDDREIADRDIAEDEAREDDWDEKEWDDEDWEEEEWDEGGWEDDEDRDEPEGVDEASSGEKEEEDEERGVEGFDEPEERELEIPLEAEEIEPVTDESRQAVAGPEPEREVAADEERKIEDPAEEELETDLEPESEPEEDESGLLWDLDAPTSPETILTAQAQAREAAAPPGERVAATLCDGLVLVAVAEALLAVGAGMAGTSQAGLLMTSPLILLATWCIFALIYAVFFTGTCGQTFGKMVMKIRVIGTDRFQVTYRQAFWRAVAYVLALLPAGLGLLIVLRDPAGRALHDRLSSTRVVKA